MASRRLMRVVMPVVLRLFTGLLDKAAVLTVPMIDWWHRVDNVIAVFPAMPTILDTLFNCPNRLHRHLYHMSHSFLLAPYPFPPFGAGVEPDIPLIRR